MRRSSLETKYFKTRSNDSIKAYKKHKNYCSRFYEKEKKEFLRNLNLSFVTDNKNFWEVVKPLFTEKGCTGGYNIVLSEKNKSINDDKKTSETLNSCSDNIAMTLDIRKNIYITEKIPTDMEPTDKAIIQFQNHPNALLIKEKVNNLSVSKELDKVRTEICIMC